MSSILWSLGSVLGLKFFIYTQYSDATICCISHFCFIMSALFTSQASQNWHLYLGLLISPFTWYQVPLTYSIISKWLEPNEINDAYTLITEVNTILLVFGNSIFNYIYSVTVSYSRNFTLYLAASLALIPLILNLILYSVTSSMTQELDQRVTERELTLIPDRLPMSASTGAKTVFLPTRLINQPMCNRHV